MKRVFADADPVLSGLVESLLLDAGIECVVRNQYLGGAVGELPVNECWPELWVLDDADAEAARRVVRRFLERRRAGTEPWSCASCGERLEGQFTQCWHCGAVRGDDPL